MVFPQRRKFKPSKLFISTNKLFILVAGPSHTFRYQQPPVSSQAVPQPQLQVPPVSPIPSHYSRPPHQMHCPTYPPSYYTAYGQHPRDMCYSPPYQSSYYTPKVYPTAYRQYMPSTSYYQTVPPSELYEHPGSMHQPPIIPPPVSQQAAQSIPTSTAPIQPQPQQMQSPNTQLVPSISNAPHLEHYSPYYTAGYNHGGGYTRSIQPPFIGKQKYGHCIHSHILVIFFLSPKRKIQNTCLFSLRLCVRDLWFVTCLISCTFALQLFTFGCQFHWS